MHDIQLNDGNVNSIPTNVDIYVTSSNFVQDHSGRPYQRKTPSWLTSYNSNDIFQNLIRNLRFILADNKRKKEMIENTALNTVLVDKSLISYIVMTCW